MQLIQVCGKKCTAGKFNFFVRWSVLVFSQVGSCVANLAQGLCRNTAKWSIGFSHQKSLSKVSKIYGLGVPLLVVVPSFGIADTSLIPETVKRIIHKPGQISVSDFLYKLVAFFFLKQKRLFLTKNRYLDWWIRQMNFL